MTRCRRHSGYSMILVIGLVAAVSVLGLAYIENNSVSVQGAVNLVNVSRARYLAECGVEQAIFWLGVSNPPGANSDGYWPGASNQHPDDSNDCYDVTVTRDPSDENRYKIVSVGKWMSSATTVGLAHRVAVWVRSRPDPTVQSQHSLLLDSGCSLPSNQTYIGSIHSNNWVLNSANVQGNVTACSFAISLVPPTGYSQGFRPSVSFPNFQPAHMTTYRLGAQTNQAVVYSHRNLDSTFPTKGPGGGSNPAWNITPDNPGGVLLCTNQDNGRGKVVLKDNLSITGTIVIDGDIYVDGNNINITAVPGFPAIVCTGHIVLTSRNIGMTVNGAILAGGSIRRDDDIRNGSLSVNGFMHVGQIELTASNGFGIVVNMTGSAERNWLYNFTIPPEEWPSGNVDIENWSDR